MICDRHLRKGVLFAGKNSCPRLPRFVASSLNEKRKRSMQEYRLSNGQQKELIIRGQELTILIPMPVDGPSDLCDIVEQSLPELPADVAINCAVNLIAVAMPGTGPSDSVGAVIGRILDGRRPRQSDIVVQISCVVATLTPPRCRGSFKKRQWPGLLLDS